MKVKINDIKLTKEQIKFYDQELKKLAKKYNLESLGLETVEREIEALDHYPIEEQTKAFLKGGGKVNHIRTGVSGQQGLAGPRHISLGGKPRAT